MKNSHPKLYRNINQANPPTTIVITARLISCFDVSGLARGGLVDGVSFFTSSDFLTSTLFFTTEVWGNETLLFPRLCFIPTGTLFELTSVFTPNFMVGSTRFSLLLSPIVLSLSLWFTKVDQLRSKRVFSTFPIGAKRKNTLGIEFYNFGFMPPFWVSFSKQRKKPGLRRSTNYVQNAFFQLSPSGRNEKTPLGSNFTISISCHHFGLAFPSSGKSRVYEGRPITFKTRFFNFPHRGETKKHPWDRILQFRFHATILG